MTDTTIRSHIDAEQTLTLIEEESGRVVFHWHPTTPGDIAARNDYYESVEAGVAAWDRYWAAVWARVDAYDPTRDPV